MQTIVYTEGKNGQRYAYESTGYKKIYSIACLISGKPLISAVPKPWPSILTV